MLDTFSLGWFGFFLWCTRVGLRWHVITLCLCTGIICDDTRVLVLRFHLRMSRGGGVARECERCSVHVVNGWFVARWWKDSGVYEYENQKCCAY